MEKLNTRRAGWASKALETFCAETGQDFTTEKEEAVVDLMADLFHFAEINGMDIDAVFETARDHYNAEILDGE